MFIMESFGKFGLWSQSLPQVMYMHAYLMVMSETLYVKQTHVIGSIVKALEIVLSLLAVSYS